MQIINLSKLFLITYQAIDFTTLGPQAPSSINLHNMSQTSKHDLTHVDQNSVLSARPRHLINHTVHSTGLVPASWYLQAQINTFPELMYGNLCGMPNYMQGLEWQQVEALKLEVTRRHSTCYGEIEEILVCLCIHVERACQNAGVPVINDFVTKISWLIRIRSEIHLYGSWNYKKVCYDYLQDSVEVRFFFRKLNSQMFNIYAFMYRDICILT